MTGLFDFDWHRTASEWMIFLAWFFVAAKLIATAFQAVLLRHDYRERPDTLLFRVMYVAGKVTPSLAAASLGIASALDGNWRDAWVYGAFAVGTAVFALVMVRLRQQGKFYGIAHLFSKRQA